MLSADESERYARVRVARARDEWRRSRVALRLLLSRYVACAPAALVFGAGERGKPTLAAPQAPEFSVSHSHGQGLIALARAAVGVDIEHCAERATDSAALLDRICSEPERRALHAAPPLDPRKRFFRLWTRKEAYCKAIGLGLYKAMPSFSVVDGPEPGRAWVDDPDAGADTPRQLHDLPDVPTRGGAPGWMACVCTALTAPRLTLRPWTPSPAD